jgi:hypothetical protein
VNRPLQFHKRGQDFICANDETLSVAMCINNPNGSPFKIEYSDVLPFGRLWYGEPNAVSNASGMRKVLQRLT